MERPLAGTLIMGWVQRADSPTILSSGDLTADDHGDEKPESQDHSDEIPYDPEDP